MASLTYTAYQARRIIKYGGLGLGMFTLLWLMVSAGIQAYIKAHPPYVPPDVKYGLLPKIVFPEKKYDKKSFTAELPSDSFPKFSDQSKVYLIARPDNTFLALEQDTNTARRLGFVDKPTQLQYGIYEFKNSVLNQTLTMNVLDGSFRLKYPYETDQLLLKPSEMSTKEVAIDAAKSFLQKADKYQSDLESGNKKVSFWKIDFEGLKSVSSLSEANLVKVDFFRKSLDDEITLVSSDINSAPISVLVSGVQDDNKKVVEVNYKYTNIDREIFSTYPIKTSEQAWNELKSGNYWPASDTPDNNMVIRKMYLAYFEPISLTNYLQPVFVFDVDKNFVAYIPAVVDSFIK